MVTHLSPTKQIGLLFHAEVCFGFDEKKYIFFNYERVRLIKWDKWVNTNNVFACACIFSKTILERRVVCIVSGYLLYIIKNKA